MTSSRAHAIGAALVAARARDRQPARATSPNMRVASVVPAPARIGAHRRASKRASATSKRMDDIRGEHVCACERARERVQRAVERD
jgi:hypothetical protein